MTANNPGGSKDRDGEEYGEEETARRRDEALRRALSTPPQPRKPTGKKGESPAKPKAKKQPKNGG